MLEDYEKVLVTGGAGFIGRHLVAALLEQGRTVNIVDDLETAHDRSLPHGAVVAWTDLRNPGQVSEAVRGADLIFHLGANSSTSSSITDPRYDFETNAYGTFNLLEAARKHGTRRIVYASTASVYGKPDSCPVAEDHPARPFTPYGMSKLAGELCASAYFRTYGLPAVTARLFWVYGPGENPHRALVEVSRYLRWHINNRPVKAVGDLDAKTRDYVHVSDAVSGLMLLADKGESGQAYNIGTGRETSLRELLGLVGGVTGSPPELERIEEVSEDSFRLAADISKIRPLGFEPTTDLPDGLKALAAELGDKPELPSGATIFKKGQKAEN